MLLRDLATTVLAGTVAAAVAVSQTEAPQTVKIDGKVYKAIDKSELIGSWVPASDFDQKERVLALCLQGMDAREAIARVAGTRLELRADGTGSLAGVIVPPKGLALPASEVALRWQAARPANSKAKFAELELTVANGESVGLKKALVRRWIAEPLVFECAHSVLQGSWKPAGAEADAKAFVETQQKSLVKAFNEIAGGSQKEVGELQKSWQKDFLKNWRWLHQLTSDASDERRTERPKTKHFVESHELLISLHERGHRKNPLGVFGTPVAREHVGLAQRVDEQWLHGDWELDAEQARWQHRRKKLREMFVSSIEKTRYRFDRRGIVKMTTSTFDKAFSDGVWALAETRGAWCYILKGTRKSDVSSTTMAMLELMPAYRTGEVLWLRLPAGYYIPLRRMKKN